jgi:hypothetical protein
MRDNAPLSEFDDSQARLEIDGDDYVLTIKNTNVDGFIIYYDWPSSVQPIAGMPTENSIVSVSPMPLINGNAQIQFGLVKAANVTLDVIDAQGNVVAQIEKATFDANYHVVDWDLSDFNGNPLVSGSYTCRLTTGGETSAYPMVIIK